jgi:outer membrane cobalamin receptor
VGTALRHAREMWSHVVGLVVWRQTQDQDTPAILDRIPPSFSTIPPTVASTDFRRMRVNGSISAHAASGWTVTGGAVYRNEWGSSVGRLVGFGPADYRLERNTGATFAEAVMERKRWSAIAGVRSDWVTGGTHRWSPRLGASAALWKGGRVRTSWGKAFKMPSFYALGQPFFGNPGLQPESSESEDAGIEQRLGRAGSVGASLYRTVYRQLVDFSPELFRLVNRSEAIARGIDLVWRERLSHGLAAQAHATYSSTRLVDSTERLRDRPRWRAGATLAAPAGSRTNLCAEALWVAARFDFQVPVPWMDRAPSYVTLNAAVDRRITTALSGFVRIDNLLNRKYQERGFPIRGFRCGRDSGIRRSAEGRRSK